MKDSKIVSSMIRNLLSKGVCVRITHTMYIFIYIKQNSIIKYYINEYIFFHRYISNSIICM